MRMPGYEFIGLSRLTLRAFLFGSVCAACSAGEVARPNTTTELASSAKSIAAPLASPATIVIADFDNQTGETVLTAALDQALGMEIAQSPFLNVLSEREMSEVLRQTGGAATETGISDVGLEVCRRTDSKSLVRGTIANLPGARYELELTAVGCTNGQTLVKDQIEAADRNHILEALNQAASRLRLGLGEPAASVQMFDVPAAAATASLDALAHFNMGVKVRRSQGDGAAVPYLKRAIQLDPKFPLPYAELTAIYRNLREPSAALQCASKAYELRDRVSEREKLKVAGVYYLATGDLDKEIRNYEIWQTKYPEDFQPYNNLGNDYAFTGQLERALAAYQRALRLRPSLISYTNVVGMEINLNQLEVASATVQEALANHFDGRYLRQNLYWLGFLGGNVAQMQQQVAWAAGKPGDEDTLLSMQSETEAYFGRLDKAQDFTERAVNSAIQAGSKETGALWRVISALQNAEVGKRSYAMEAARSALALSTGRDVKLIAAFTLARCGDSARATALLRELQSDYPTDFLLRHYWLPTIDAAIELDKNQISKALKNLETPAPYELSVGTFVDFLYPAYIRGEVYLRAHKPDAAAAEFRKLLEHRGIVTNFVTGALAHLQVARAYAAAADNAKARAAYRDFLTLWKDADPEIPILEQAKAEVETYWSGSNMSHASFHNAPEP